MTKKDKIYVEEVAKQLGQMPDVFGASVVIELRSIIDRLDKQLTEIVEAGEPFRLFYDSALSILPDDNGIAWKAGEVAINTKDFRHLAEAMKGVKDE